MGGRSSYFFVAYHKETGYTKGREGRKQKKLKGVIHEKRSYLQALLHAAGSFWNRSAQYLKSVPLKEKKK